MVLYSNKECVQLLTRVSHVSRVPLIKRQEQVTSVGSKVTNTLPIFSRTDWIHLAAKTTYHCKGLQAPLAAHEFCTCCSIYVECTCSDLNLVFSNQTQPKMTWIAKNSLGQNQGLSQIWPEKGFFFQILVKQTKFGPMEGYNPISPMQPLAYLTPLNI